MAKRTKVVKRSQKHSDDFLSLLKEKIKKIKPLEKNQSMVLGLLALWLAFCAVTVTFPQFNWVLPKNVNYFLDNSWIYALLLFGTMTLFVRLFIQTKSQKTVSNIPRPWVVVILLAVFAAGGFLCLFHIDKPSGGYTLDCAFFIRTARQLKDVSNYGPAYIFETGLLPLWPYTADFIWHLMPSSTGLVIQRLTNTFFDFGIIFFMYLAGKEIAGRRLGLLAAALTAISKPLIEKVVSGYPSNVLAFGIAIALWLTIRLNRKKNIYDFLIWGAGVAFLAYTTAPFEPFVPFFIFIGLGFVWWNNRAEMKIKDAPVWVWLSLALFLVYFLCCNNAFPNGAAILKQIKSSSLILLGVILGASAFVFSRRNKDDKKNLWIKWFLGSWLATILSYIEIANDYMLGRVQEHSLMPGAGFLSPAYLSSCFQRLPSMLQWLFWTANDKSDMALAGDPFFCYPELICIGLGLVFCVAKPNAKKTLLVLTALLGVLPILITSQTHSGFLVGCVAPFLLISAVGINDLFEVVSGAFSKIRFLNVFLSFLFIVFWGWSAQVVFSRVYTQWSEKRIAVIEDAARDSAKGYRVYVTLEFPPEYYEGPEIYSAYPINQIDLSNDEKVPDVVVYVDVRKPEVINNLKKYFPQAQWSGVNDPYDASHPMVMRCEIQAHDLLQKKQKLFVVSRLSGPFWKRTFFTPRAYLNLSLADWEDGVVDIHKPVPAAANVIYNGQTVELEGTVQMKRDGLYEIDCQTGNRSKVFIDNQEIFDLTFPVIGSYVAQPVDRKIKLDLKAGDHKIKVISCFQASYGPPDITIKPAASTERGESLWKNFVFQ
ncbi:MAG TPA: hypothetical protein VK791_11255 [bacterium]|jgi:hypothetical protein|nr:hypothetical protein [bacterium]